MAQSNKKHTCPRCGGTRTFRHTQRIPWYITTPPPGSINVETGTTDAGWQACLDCWHKWDGVVADPDLEDRAIFLFPPGVERRK